MQARVRWTAALDDDLRAMRAVGMTWDAVAASMGLGRNTVIERGRRIGARRLRLATQRVEAEPADRPTRPAGHPFCWGLITAGTVLAGEPYPFPVFL
jgi:hypothetical protein